MDIKGNILPTFSMSPVGANHARRVSSSRNDSATLDPAKLQEKREKARERQRRKRERDRRRDSDAQVAAAQSAVVNGQGMPHYAESSGSISFGATDLSPAEMARRERVRAAARDRQRKHRALVKQKKMAELGIAMGNETMSTEELHYTLGPDGQYQPIMAHPNEIGHEPPFPQGHTGGQTFASTLLLSFSCAPLLKQHLLRTLHMTNEELASLEPVLSAAWDQWDHARRVHYAEQAAKAAEQNAPSEPHPYTDAAPPYDFRARFHRPLIAPSPFRTAVAAPGQPIPNHASSTSASPAEQPRANEAIDPSLAVPRTGGESSASDDGEEHEEKDSDAELVAQMISKE